jgi:hypothetical protein
VDETSAARARQKLVATELKKTYSEAR